MAYGDIKSCKLEIDEAGISKGYGYVTYYRAEDAVICINSLNDKEIKGEKIQIMDMITPSSDSKNVVYMKHLPLIFEERNLKELLSTYGEITNIKMCMKDQKFTGAAIVSFSDFRSATAAIRDINYKATTFPGQLPLYINFLQKKEERSHNLGMKSLRDQKNKILMSRTEPVNLFAKLIENNYFKNQEEFEHSLRLFLKVVMLSEFHPINISCNYSRTSAVVTLKNMKDAFDFMERYSKCVKPEFFIELIQNTPQPIVPSQDTKIMENSNAVNPNIQSQPSDFITKNNQVKQNVIPNIPTDKNDPMLNRFDKMNINENHMIPINIPQVINHNGHMGSMYPHNQMIPQHPNIQSERVINMEQITNNQHFYNGFPTNHNVGNLHVNPMNNMNMNLNKMGNIMIPSNQEHFRNPQMQNFNPLINNPHTFPINQPTHIQPQIPIIIAHNQPTFNKFNLNGNINDRFQVPTSQPFNQMGYNLNGNIQEINHMNKNMMLSHQGYPQQQIPNQHIPIINQHNQDVFGNALFSAPYLVESEKLLFSQNDRLSNIEGKVEMNFKEERLKEMNSEELSNEIYELVATIYPHDAAKITGMLSDLGDDQMRRLLLNPLEMKDLMDQAYKVSTSYLLF